MDRTNNGPRRGRVGGVAALAAAIGAGVALAGGCAKSPERERAVWFPFADVRLATSGGSTDAAIVRDGGGEVLVIERETPGDVATPDRRLVWIVALDADAPFGRAIEVGGPMARGWLLEQVAGEPTHAAPLTGRVTKFTLTDAGATVGVDLAARTTPAGPGRGLDDRVTLSKRLVAERREQSAYPAFPKLTRSGVDTVGEEDRTPDATHRTFN